MKGREDLFHLVHSMSRSEKRYFTIDAQKGGKKGSKYLDLFRAINDMNEYDEGKLKKKFKHLSVDKSYLYEAILRSMRDYRSAKSYAAQIKEKLLDCKYLFELSLYDQCEARLQEAKNLAQEIGDELSLLEINREERALYKVKRKSEFKEALPQLSQDKEDSIAALQEEFEYLDFYDELILKMEKGLRLSNEIDKQQLQKKYNYLTEKYADLTSSKWGELRKLETTAFYHQMISSEDIFDNYESVIRWWNDNEKFKQEQYNSFLVEISNFLGISFQIERYDKIEEYLGFLEKETPSSFHLEKVLFRNIALYKSMYYINRGIAKGIQQFTTEIEQGLIKYDINPIRRLVILFNALVLLFINEQFEDCKRFSEKLLSHSMDAVKIDIYIAAKILDLIVEYELHQEDDLMDSALRSTNRYLSKKGIEKNDFEQQIVGYLKGIFNASNSKKREEELTEMKQFIDLYKEKNRVALGLDELLLLWIAGKRESLPIISVLQKVLNSNKKSA